MERSHFVSICFLSGLWLLSSPLVLSQTRVDLYRQAGDPDFRSFSATYPFAMSSSPPATCTVGQLFFNTSSPAGQNLFGCTTPNVWSVMGAGTSQSPSSPIIAGPSGAFACAVTQSGTQCDLVTAIVGLKPSANIWSGLNDFSSAPKFRLPAVSGVPTSGCATKTDVTSVAVRTDAQAPLSSLYVCAQTSPGGYSWELTSGSSSTASTAKSRAVAYQNAGHGNESGPAVYNIDGTTSSDHIVRGQVSQARGTSSTVSLSGRAAFSSSTSYMCTADTPYVAIQYSTGSAFNIVNPAGGLTHYICVGN